MWSHTESETCHYVYRGSGRDIVAFDFDDTLIDRKTRDILPNVKEVLQELHQRHDIVIFSNQLGVARKKVTNEEIQTIFKNFIQAMSLPISVFYSIEEDGYRKPNRGMYDLLNSFHTETTVHYYCGDAAGRVKDFSTSDLYFANNCSLRFRTPEEVFANANSETLACKKINGLKLYSGDQWIDGKLSNPREIVPIQMIEDITLPILTSKKTLIIMVGAPGSGKTSLAQRMGLVNNMVVVNGDSLKNKKEQIRVCQESIHVDDSSGIIIDNTNPQKSTREEWMQRVPDDWDKRILYIDIPKPVSFHLTKYRHFHGYKRIPSVAIHIYYKRLEEPSDDECLVANYKYALSSNELNHRLRFIWR